MSAMIMKRNSRKPLAIGPVGSVGINFNGVGRMENAPCYEFSIGDIRVFLSDTTLHDLLESWRAQANMRPGLLVFVP